MSLRLIATSLGLSVTTVSRALAGYSDVAEETRRRVKAEADRIGYAPNAIARRLQKGRTDAIGIVAPSGVDAISDSYLYGSIVGAWSRLSELDRDLVMLPSIGGGGDPRSSAMRAFRRAIEERRVDGVLLMRTRRDDWRIRHLREARLPFVVCGADHLDAPDILAIGVDNRRGAEMVLSRLAGFGHRDVAIVVPEGDLEFALARTEIFREAAPAHGIVLQIETDLFCEDGGRAATARLLARSDHPTAIVYFANRMALGGLRAISDSVLVPGRHVSVVSFGDNANLLYATPPVTALWSPADAMARHAVDVLIGEIEGRRVEPIRHWPLTLIRRQSDGPFIPRPRVDGWSTASPHLLASHRGH